MSKDAIAYVHRYHNYQNAAKHLTEGFTMSDAFSTHRAWLPSGQVQETKY